VPAFADVNQGADDVAHHVMQKRVGDELEHDIVAAPADIQMFEIAHRRFRLAFGRAKCTEVVLANEVARGRAHAFNIERQMNPADASLIDCRPHRMV